MTESCIIYVLLIESIGSKDKTPTHVTKVRGHEKQARGKNHKKHIRKK